MKTVQWLHTADLHLDAPIKGWKGSKEQLWRRHEEHRLTFRRIISIVQKQKIPFLFLAGDFLEHGYVSHSTLQFVLDQFARIPDVKILIAPGNHDPYREGSIYERDIWPDHVHIFRGDWERLVFPDFQLTIYGRGFTEFEEKKSHLPQVSEEDGYRIMVTHGDYGPSGKGSSYFPLWEKELAPLEMDYVALGHIHQADTYRLHNQRRTVLRYPGSPEAHNWKELGERTVTVGTLTNEGVHMEWLPVHTRRYEVISVDVTGCEFKEQLLEKLLDSKMSCKDCYVLCQLVGRRTTELVFQQDLPWISEKLHHEGWRDVYFEDHSIPDFDLEYFREQNPILRSFMQKMERKMEEEPHEDRQELIQKALYKGLEALCSRGKGSAS